MPDAQRLVIGLLVLAFGHAPLPWVHSHAGLTIEQLAAHAQQFHPGMPLPELPQGLHLHFNFDVAGPGVDSELEAVDAVVVRLCEELGSGRLPAILASGAIEPRAASEVVGRKCRRWRWPVFPRQDVFKAYGAFLS